MKLKTVIAFLLLLMLALSACNINDPAEATSDTTPPATAETLYDAACSKLRAASHCILSYDFSRQRTIGNDTYTEQVTSNDSYSNIGSENMQALIKKTLHYGSYQTEYVESFMQNTGYCTVNGSYFASSMDANTFLSRQLPAVLIDRTLYGSVAKQEVDNGIELTFSQPSALESWANPYGQATLISASATALLSTDGNLLEYHYEAAYTCGTVNYQLKVDSKLMLPLQLDLSSAHPEYPENPTMLTYLDAPKHLLQAVGDLFTAQSISAHISQALDSRVYTIAQTQESDLHFLAEKDTASALWSTTLTMTDYRGDPVTKTQTDRYEDGILTRIVNGELQPEETQTAEQVRIKWENQILNSFFALNYLSNATVTDAGDTLVLNFSGNEAFCSAVSASFRSVIPNELESIASSYETGAAGGSLTIDKATGLPVAMGMEFARTHVIDGISYPLTFTLTQTLKLSDASTQSALTPAA